MITTNAACHRVESLRTAPHFVFFGFDKPSRMEECREVDGKETEEYGDHDPNRIFRGYRPSRPEQGSGQPQSCVDRSSSAQREKVRRVEARQKAFSRTDYEQPDCGDLCSTSSESRINV